MKNLTFILIIILCKLTLADAQSVPQGMSYQAVLRNAQGDILADADVSLSFRFITYTDREQVWYEETHYVRTNSFGLVNLVLGGGQPVSGDFAAIPWSAASVSLRVGLDDKGGHEFISLGENRLLSVPYAMHAATASEVSGSDDRGLTVPKSWNVNGNTGTDPAKNFVGTPDRKDLVFRTFNMERMRILAGGGFIMTGDLQLSGNAIVDGALSIMQHLAVNGDIAGAGNLQAGGNLQVTGDGTIHNLHVNQYLTVADDITGMDNLSIIKDATIGNDLKVTGKTTLGGDFNVLGDVHLAKKLTVAGATALNNTLDVSGDVNLAAKLNVNGETRINNAMWVTGAVNLLSQLNVISNTHLQSDLYVYDDADIAGDLSVDGGFTLGGELEIVGKTTMTGSVGIGVDAPSNGMLHVKGFAADHLVLFENTNTGAGDGLAIKLHKNKTRGDNNFVTFYNGNNGIAGRIEGYDVSFDLLESFPVPTAAAGKELGCLLLRPENLMMFGLNHTVDRINFIGSLWNDYAAIPPFTIPDVPSMTIPGFSLFGGLGLPSPLPNVPSISFPETNVFGGLTIPDVPGFDFSSAIGEIPHLEYVGTYVSDLIGCPTGSFPSAYPNIMGWLSDLGGWAMANDMKELMGTGLTEIVVKSAVWGIMRAAKDGGVTYGSKGADYAEYLERLDGEEKMIQGDIVGVFGGKISKNTDGADQILAISSIPIVLGNQPDPDSVAYYEKVGFIGQVPTFVRGKVEVGDYILPSGKHDGIGRAVHAADLSIDELSQVLGKAWSGSDRDGISLINVSIGLRPTEITTILKGLESRISSLEASIARMSN